MRDDDLESKVLLWSEDKNAEFATRLREYKNSPHHINPMSQRFHRLLDDVIAYLLSETGQKTSPYLVGLGSLCEAKVCDVTNHGSKSDLHPEYVTSESGDV